MGADHPAGELGLGNRRPNAAFQEGDTMVNTTSLAVIAGYVAVGLLTARLMRDDIHQWTRDSWPATYKREGVPPMVPLFVMLVWPIVVVWKWGLAPLGRMLAGDRDD